MRVMIVNHYAIPPVEAGGTRHYSLAKELIARGHDVQIVAANFSHQTKTPIVDSVREVIFKRVYDGVPFIFVNVPAYQGNTLARFKNMLSFAVRVLYDRYFKHIEPPDIVIGSSPHPFAAWAAQKMAARWRVPFVFEVRDLWPQSLIELGRISPQHPAVLLLARLERYLYNRAAKIVVLLPGAHQYIKSVGIDANKVVWIPNGVDFSLYDHVLQSAGNNKFTVMYAGAHGLANGLESVIKCAEILDADYRDKIVFRLVGDGPDKDILRKSALEKHLINVQFDEPIPKWEIPRILMQADAFVVIVKDLPLYKYGISLNKIYDYLASARPVVIGANAFNNPVEEAGAGFTAPPGDPEKLAMAVLRLYHMTNIEREQMGRNGRKYVQENHDLKSLALKLEEVLLETALNDGSLRKKNSIYPFIKRCIDIMGSGLGLLLMAPVLVVLAVLIRTQMGRPVFFKQVRPGLEGQPFTMYKFRTMTDQRDDEGALLADDLRLTRLGKLLRSASLDEFPELFNVFKGEMSLVGPRPLLLQYLDRYTPEQARRHHVKPGITGWAQVHGRNALKWEEKFMLDIWYVEHCSLWLDIKILVMTLSKVFKREGINAEGRATMPEFIGSDKKSL